MTKVERDGRVAGRLDAAMRLSAALGSWLKPPHEDQPTTYLNNRAGRAAFLAAHDVFCNSIIDLINAEIEDEDSPPRPAEGTGASND